MNYTFSEQEFQFLIRLIDEIPTKYGIGMLDFLKTIVAKAQEQQKQIEAGNEMSQ